jgi:hypothetical protein
VPALFDPFTAPEHIKLTARARKLTRLREIYEGRQYDGRPDWWTGSRSGKATTDPVPLRQRKPCIIYRLPQAATGQVVRFLFGDGRFPQIAIKATIEETEDENGKVTKKRVGLDGGDLSADEAEQLQTWLSECIDRSRLQPIMRSLARIGISCGTAVAVLSFVEGQFCIESLYPEHCAAEFERDDPSAGVLRLVQCYEYEAEVVDEEGKPKSKRFCFRREWNATECRVWEPAEVKPGEPLRWGAYTATVHGFSFCPVVWIPNAANVTSGYDGVSLFDDSEDEIEALDFALSQRHRGIAYLGTPQMVETGVLAGDGPQATGSKANRLGNDTYRPADESKAQADLHSGVPARRMGPGEIWTYEGEKVNVSLLETSGKAF